MYGYGGLLALLVFIIIWRKYLWNTDDAGAPYVGLEPHIVEEVIRLADIQKNEIFYDLGSGDGRIVISAALHGAKAYGVEIDRLRVWYSRGWIQLLKLGKTAKIIKGNIFHLPLNSADIVCTYLLERTNSQLSEKFYNELKPGCKIITVGFKIPGWNPEYVSPIRTHYGPVYLYKR